MASRDSKQFYLRYRNRRVSFQNKLYNDYYRSIKSVFDDVLHNLESGSKEISSVKSIQDRMIRGTKAGYVMIATAGFRYGLEDAQEAYGKPLPILVEKEISNEELAILGLRTVIIRLRERAMVKIVTIANSLHDKLRSVFQTSIENMESHRQLTARIKEVAGSDYPKYEAQRIAQTETTRVFNRATLEGYKKSTVVSGKEWISNLMGNPRHPPESEFNHEIANGEVVGLDELFVMTGEELMFPGDEDGSPENVINCHCALKPVISI